MGVSVSSGAFVHKDARKVRRSFLARGDTVVFFGTFDESGNTNFQDINNSGYIAGSNTSQITDSTTAVWACVFNPDVTSFQSVGVLPGGNSSDAYGINDGKWVVGASSEGGNSYYHAFIWKNGGSLIKMGSLNTYASSYAYEINESGQSVGVSDNRAVTWDGSGGITPLDEWPGATQSAAYDINERGEIVGQIKDASGPHGVLWLPAPNYGLAAGVHKLTDVLMHDDGFYVHLATSISDHGLIVGKAGWDQVTSSYGVVLQQSFIVNSTGDAPDADLNDGECKTSTPGECTLRAALQQANATRNFSEISFNIPSGGTSGPIIEVLSELPPVTDETVVDASGQPEAGRVYLDGSALTDPSAPGLTLSGYRTRIRSLGIGNFPGHGVSVEVAPGIDVEELSGTLENCRIGLGPDGDSTWGNGGHGVYASDYTNDFFIGDYDLEDFTPAISDADNERGNIIAYNSGAGVFREGDATVLGNSIYRNGGLGIDISPEGVRPQITDSTNYSIKNNYPVLDSLGVGDGQVTVYGHIEIDADDRKKAPGNQTGSASPEAEWNLIVEIYVNSECDDSGHGEGRGRVGIDSVVAGPGRYGYFAIAFPAPLLSVWSVTATASSGSSTSEFAPCLVPPIIVNSAGDMPDLTPDDGVCWTGLLVSDGRQECTFRAALEVADRLPGFSNIVFDIPGEGIPVIAPATSLPVVNDSITINGRSQGPVGYVELNGINVGGGSGVDGLTLAGRYIKAQGLNIHSFSGSGIRMMPECEYARVLHNIIGTDTSGTVKRPNLHHGIRVSGATSNYIGSHPILTPDSGNVIAFNLGAGIFVDSGHGNYMFGNSIYDNGSLGIDLAPAGVNAHDSLSGIEGANGNVRAPLIDWVSDRGITQTVISGRVRGGSLSLFSVELFFNDSCDASGQGEGKFPIATTTGVSPLVPFEIDFYEDLGPNQFYSLIATDQNNNSSEFSTCWPQKVIEVVDANGTVLANKTLALYRVTNNPPTLTDTLIANVTTDANGRVDLESYYRNHGLDTYSRVKLALLLHTEPRAKSAIPELGTGYSVWLDNARFDSLTYAMTYDTLSHDPVQTITLNHTTLAINLVASIEWEAGDAYRDSLVQCFRVVSNHLYDVTDGQARLDTVVIFDNSLEFRQADIQIRADNSGSAESAPKGFFSFEDHHLSMPRCWYGSPDKGVELSPLDYPMALTKLRNYRTLSHELGHYFFGFFDEYDGGEESAPGDVINDIPIYGYMQLSADPSQVGSEMSWSRQYDPDRRKVTEQWGEYQKSCWDLFKATFEKTYDGIPAPILRPDDRFIPEGRDYFNGPNDSPEALNYDVGALISFYNPHQTRESFDPLFVFMDPTNSLPLAAASVYHRQYGHLQGSREYFQGSTSSAGMIRVMGAEAGDTLEVGGRFLYSVGSSRPTLSVASESFDWLSGSFEVGSDTSATVSLRKVNGRFPLVIMSESGVDELTLNLSLTDQFSAPPTLQVRSRDGVTSDHVMTATSVGYTTTVSDSLTGSSIFAFQALDDSSQSFIFHADCETSMIGAGGSRKINSSTGDFSVITDTANSSSVRATVISTDFPTNMDSLASGSRRVSRVHSLSLYPDGTLAGTNRLKVSYSSAAIDTTGTGFDQEASVRIFRWIESQLAWERVGGIVDTAQEFVIAAVDQPGVYAAFTTDAATGIDDETGAEDVLPYNFQMSQNYPNPFNPVTTIEYSLPERSHVTIAVYNVLGQRVRSLVDREESSGSYTVTWDGTDASGRSVATGVYLYRFEAGDQTQTKKMLLLK